MSPARPSSLAATSASSGSGALAARPKGSPWAWLWGVAGVLALGWATRPPAGQASASAAAAHQQPAGATAIGEICPGGACQALPKP